VKLRLPYTLRVRDQTDTRLGMGDRTEESAFRAGELALAASGNALARLRSHGQCDTVDGVVLVERLAGT
jgi:hypothetical protein